MRTRLAPLALALATTALAAAATPAPAAPVATGQAAPAFTLDDAAGKPFSLLPREGRPAVVVFYRGFW